MKLYIEGIVTHDPSKAATAFNSYSIDSTKTLSHNLSGSKYSLTPLNTDAPILTFREVTNQPNITDKEALILPI